jgi:4-hydroxybenzoyl-CoA reductase subunit beta
MMTLPPFELHQPETVEDAVALLSKHGANAKVLAGGTDLLPNMKHRLFTPAHVVSLAAIPDLEGIHEEAGAIRIGARVTLARICEAPLILEKLPSLAQAARQVAGPQLREMGTLGGNICLDTRCVYYNQTYFWRKALGFCLKKDGTVCHVVKGGQRCVAAASNDTAPVLMTLGATVRAMGPRGHREIPMREFYVPDGIHNTVLSHDELVVDARIPVEPNVRAGYHKLRIRAAIDYPALTLAVAFKEQERRLAWVRLVVSALGARPHEVKRLDVFQGRMLDESVIAEVGEAARKQCHPLTNISVDPLWRRDVLSEMVRRCFAEAA